MSGMVGRGKIVGSGGGGSVGRGGCVGGIGVSGIWVGGGCVGGMFVGTTDVLVEAARVLVGFRRVDVGCTVGAEVPVTVMLGLGTLVRGVPVSVIVIVGLGVRVADGVGVGNVEVGEGTSEAVWVGAVDVGNGPRSASDVSARAVLVPLTLNGFSLLAALPNESQKNKTTKRTEVINAVARRSI
jgi:hypothetical protein